MTEPYPPGPGTPEPTNPFATSGETPPTSSPVAPPAAPPAAPPVGQPGAAAGYGTPAPTAPGYGAAGYPAPGYPPAQAYAPAPADPGRGFGIAGLILAFFGPLAVVGLILSILGMSKSRKAGRSNGVALAGLIVSILVILATIAVGVVIAIGVARYNEFCDVWGPGVWFNNGVTVTCY